MKTLDPGALRRPTFTPGVAITLFDGQAWELPRPTFGGFYPRRTRDGAIEAAPGYQFGAGFDQLVDAFIDAQEWREELSCLFAIAVYLLLFNYDVADEDLPLVLFRVPADDPRSEVNQAMWEQLRDLALGKSGPKPTPAGEGSPSSPAGSTPAG